MAFAKGGRRHNGNTPADYVAMWKHVWGLFKEAGATNAYWVWSPNLLYVNADNTAEQAAADYAALYPGDGYVDWIGLDGYNDGVKSKWKSFPELFDASYQAITKLTAKPLMIAEFGCSEKGAPAGTSKAAWITQTYLHDIPGRYPRVRLVNWFDRDKSKQGETDWRFNSSPDALAAYRAAVNCAGVPGGRQAGTLRRFWRRARKPREAKPSKAAEARGRNYVDCRLPLISSSSSRMVPNTFESEVPPFLDELF